MLAANVTETPRPRPPAKVRRSTSLKTASTPPPAYAVAFDLSPRNKPPLESLLGSPLLATFQRVGWDHRMKDQLSPTTEEDREWMDEKSREELSGLLLKAEEVIRERENDLGMASAVCKTLYENNVVLKSKHQALLKRLPPSPSSSPSPEPPSRTSSRYSISLSRPVSEYELSPLTYKNQARKISFSTSEISHLADQNAELLEKLERMETEAAQADHTGRRELKRLEKEILSLREELEKTQAKSEELEEKTKAGLAWDTEKVVQEVWRKKEEREAKFRAMRNISQGSMVHAETDFQVKNFAPEGSSFGVSSSTLSHLPPRRPSTTPFSHTKSSSGPLASHPECSLIAQLLEKIQELEQTNTRIIEQQTETTNQLNAMQRETEQITKIYECFADEDIIEVTSDTESEPREEEPISNDDTIRFRSLKRNLVAQVSNSPRKDRLQSLNTSTVSRARKSVFGLFDAAEDDRQESPTPAQLFASDLPGSRRTGGHRSSQSIGSTSLASPAFSAQSITPSRSQPSNLSNRGRTLEAELGNDLTDWGLNSSNHHLRAGSLYQLSQISAPPSPSLSRWSRERSRSRERDTLPTPDSIGNPSLRLSVEPPTPEKSGVRGNDAGFAGRQSLRLHRMSDTVRSRTSRWVNGRFEGSPRGSTKIGIDAPAEQGDDTAEEIPRPLTPLSLHLTSVFDGAVLNVTGEEGSPAADNGKQDTEEHKDRLALEKRRHGLGDTMLQVWLWLQFAMVVFIFVWSMARRGPESVLGKPGQRRVSSSR